MCYPVPHARCRLRTLRQFSHACRVSIARKAILLRPICLILWLIGPLHVSRHTHHHMRAHLLWQTCRNQNQNNRVLQYNTASVLQGQITRFLQCSKSGYKLLRIFVMSYHAAHAALAYALGPLCSSIRKSSTHPFHNPFALGPPNLIQPNRATRPLAPTVFIFGRF